jgi:hypothetical protein
MPLWVGIIALVVALPGCINAMVSLYDRFLANRERPVALPAGKVGPVALWSFNLISLALLGVVIVGTWIYPPTANIRNGSGNSNSSSSGTPSGLGPSANPAAANIVSGGGGNASGSFDGHVDSRAYLNQTVEDLWTSMCEGRTEIQCNSLVSEVKGEWIAAEGRIGNILPGGSALMLVGQHNRGVQCLFVPKWHPRLALLRRNDPIKFAGQISGYAVGTLILRDCDITS